jgi:hypothetical protein
MTGGRISLFLTILPNFTRIELDAVKGGNHILRITEQRINVSFLLSCPGSSFQIGDCDCSLSESAVNSMASSLTPLLPDPAAAAPGRAGGEKQSPGITEFRPGWAAFPVDEEYVALSTPVTRLEFLRTRM